MAIDEKKKIIASYHDINGILYGFNDRATFQNTTISYESEQVQKVARDIVELFLLELQFAIGSFMAKTVEFSDLQRFAMHYYLKREKIFTVVKKETVEQNYETLYLYLIKKPSNL
uniref:Uncharacterized protein n=1 Tax=Panagrolaimus davidi TaxID=227884 RepID=A0A914QCD4_9BILA